MPPTPIIKERSAANIRTKVSRFDFEDVSKANIQTVQTLGSVASVIEHKTDEQNELFKDLLVKLDYLPRNAIEQQRQQRDLFREMAKMVASIELMAETEKDPQKRKVLIEEAKDLRRVGKGYYRMRPMPDKAMNVKEALAQRFLGMRPSQLHRHGGILGTYREEFSKLTGLFGKKETPDTFENRVRIEKKAPAQESALKAAIDTAREKLGIGKEEESEKPRRGSQEGGGSNKLLLKVMNRRVIPILKNIGSSVEAIRRSLAPKRNKKGQYTDASGKTKADRLKDNMTPEDRAELKKEALSRRSKKQPRKGGRFARKPKATPALTPTEKKPTTQTPIQATPKQPSETLLPEAKIEGSMTETDESGGGILALLPILGPAGAIALAIGGLSVIAYKIYDAIPGFGKENPEDKQLQNQQFERLEETAKKQNTTVEKLLKKNKTKGAEQTHSDYDRWKMKQSIDNPDLQEQYLIDPFATPRAPISPKKKPTIDVPRTNTAEPLSKASEGVGSPVIISPSTINNYNSSSTSGGGEKKTSSGLPSVRSTDNAFMEYWRVRQSRIFA